MRLAQPELSARVRDIDDADAILVVGTDPLHSSPILDLRIRKAIRRNGAALAVATERPTALDGGAEAIARYAPGERRATSSPSWPTALPRRRRSASGATPRRRDVLRDAEQASSSSGASGSAARARRAPRPCSSSPTALDLAGKDGSGLLEVPDLANARGLREAGCLPDAGPGLTRLH